MSLFSSTILNPLFKSTELEAAKEGMAYEIRDFWSKADHILPDLAVNTAYRENTLGMPLLCPEEQLAILGEGELRGYMSDWYRPERMVVSGVGIPHEELVELAFEHFGNMPESRIGGGGLPLTTKPSSRVGLGSGSGSGSGAGAGAKTYATVSSAPVDSSGRVIESDYERLVGARATYTGGEQYLEKPDEEVTNLIILFEGLGALDPDIVSGVLSHFTKKVWDRV